MRPPQNLPKFSPETCFLSTPQKSTFQEFEKNFLSQVTHSSSRSLKVPQAHPLDGPVAIFIVVGGTPPRRFSITAWRTPGRTKEVTPVMAVMPRRPSRHNVDTLNGCETRCARCITADQSGANQQRYNPNKKNLRSQKKSPAKNWCQR